MKSSDYFAKRSELRMKRMHDKATKCMAKVNRAYDDSLDRLNKEIDHIMGKLDNKSMIDIQNHLVEKISYDKYKELLKIYNATNDKKVKAEVKRIIKENAATYRIQRKEALARAIEIEKLRQVDSQLNLGGKHLKNVYSSVLNELGSPGVSKEYLNEILNHNWAGSNFSKRVWHNQTVLANTLQSNLMQSFISGKSNSQIADELEYHTNLGRFAANRLIRTETSYMVNSADIYNSKQRGIKAKKFEANLDSRTSKVCREHNQKIIPIDKIKIGVNAPPLHPYCRSFMSDMLEGWDYETDEELQALINEKVDNNAENGYNKISGGISGAITNTLSDKAERHAELRYEFIRNNKYDVEKIAKNTGYSVEQIQSIKNYLFIDKHDLGDKIDRFVPDFCIAQSWDRLTTGKIEKHDLILLKHEIMEQELIENGLTQDEAHKITSQKYNYQKEAEEFYDKLEERKKRKK